MVCLHYVLIHSEMFTARQCRLYILLKKSIQTARTHKTGHVFRVLLISCRSFDKQFDRIRTSTEDTRSFMHLFKVLMVHLKPLM